MSKFSEKYSQYFEEETPLAEDCVRCKLREQCQNANMMTIEPRCLINGASLQNIKVKW